MHGGSAENHESAEEEEAAGLAVEPPGHLAVLAANSLKRPSNLYSFDIYSLQFHHLLSTVSAFQRLLCSFRAWTETVCLLAHK